MHQVGITNSYFESSGYCKEMQGLKISRGHMIMGNLCLEIQFLKVTLGKLNTNFCVADLDHLDESIIRALALQRLQEITTGVPIASTHKSDMKPAPSISKPLSVVYAPRSLPARAVLYPVLSCKVMKELAQWLPLRQLTVGIGGNVDVDLSQYGHCNFVSPLHAHIFYDNVRPP